MLRMITSNKLGRNPTVAGHVETGNAENISWKAVLPMRSITTALNEHDGGGYIISEFRTC